MAVHALSPPHPLAARIRSLAGERDPALLLDPEGAILFVNEAWERTVEENAGDASCLSGALVGSSWLDHIAGTLPRQQHQFLFEQALHRSGGGPGGAVFQASESNSSQTARLIASRFEPVVAATHEVVGVAVIHRLVRERPLGEVYAVVSRPEAEYLNPEGTLHQCSCCRRTRRLDGSDWDFVPELLACTGGRVEFLFCPLCLDLHYQLPEN